jgi:hypothetical protein
VQFRCDHNAWLCPDLTFPSGVVMPRGTRSRTSGVFGIPWLRSMSSVSNGTPSSANLAANSSSYSLPVGGQQC